MLGFGASALETIDIPAPSAKAPTAAQPVNHAVAASDAPKYEPIAAIADIAMLLPQNFAKYCLNFLKA